MSRELLTPKSTLFDSGEVTGGTYVFADRLNDRTTVVETRSGAMEFVRRIIGRNGIIEPPEPDEQREVDVVTALSDRIFEKTGIRLNFNP